MCFDRFLGFSSLWAVIGWCLSPCFSAFLGPSYSPDLRILLLMIFTFCLSLSLTARHFLALSVIWIYWIILTKLDHISRKELWKESHLHLISILTYFILSLDVCRRIYVWWTDGGSLLVFVICVDKERIILKPFIGTVTDHYVTSKHGSLGQGMRDIRYIWEYSAALLFETFYWNFSNFLLSLYRNFTLVDNVDQLLKICKSLTVNS